MSPARVVVQCFAVMRPLRLTSRMLSSSALKTYGGRRPITTGVREQCADWSARILGETSAVGAQCSIGSSDLGNPAIRPFLGSFGVAVGLLVAHHRAIQFKWAVLVHRVLG